MSRSDGDAPRSGPRQQGQPPPGRSPLREAGRSLGPHHHRMERGRAVRGGAHLRGPHRPLRPSRAGRCRARPGRRGATVVINLILLLGLFALLLVGRVPVAFAMGLASLGTLAITAQPPPIILVNRMAASADSFILIAIPLFILTGAYMDTGGIAMRLLTLVRGLVGHLRGSLGMITVVKIGRAH